MVITELTDSVKVLHSQLRERAQESPKGGVTRHHIVYEDEIEVAFLSLDPRPDLNLMVIYELLVPTELRGRGIGTRILGMTEELARCCGFPRVRLVPEPFGIPSGAERDLARMKLIRWYEKRGYRVASDTGSKEWQKEL